MLTIQEMKDMLEKALPPKRFKHSLGVYETALKMAEHYGMPQEKLLLPHFCMTAGVKCRPINRLKKPKNLAWKLIMWNAASRFCCMQNGRLFAEHKYGITDPEVLEAIRLHSTGAPDMTELDMVVYLADLIEPGRDFDGVEKLRKVCFENLEKPWLNLTPIPLNICWIINF